MTTAWRDWAKSTGFLFMLLCAYAFGILATRADFSKSKAGDPPIAPLIKEAQEIDDSWILKRMQEADKTCGPVPYEISATRDWFQLTCGKPPNVGKLRMPPPRGG